MNYNIDIYLHIIEKFGYFWKSIEFVVRRRSFKLKYVSYFQDGIGFVNIFKGFHFSLGDKV